MQQTLGRSRQLGIKLYEFTPLYNHMYTSSYLFEMICNIRRTGWSRGLRWTNMASKPWWRLSQADQSGDVVWIYSLEKENRLPFVSEGETAYKGCRSGAYDHMSSANCNTPRKVVSWTHRLSTICFWSMLPCHAQCIPGNWQIKCWICWICWYASQDVRWPSPWLRLDHYQSKLQRWQARGAWRHSWIDADIQCGSNLASFGVYRVTDSHWELCLIECWK